MNCDELCPNCRAAAAIIAPHDEHVAMLEIVTENWWHGEYHDDLSLVRALFECAQFQREHLPHIRSN